MTTMKALRFKKFGYPSTETFEIKEIPAPTKADLKPDDVLIKVRAASLNPIDWKLADGIIKLVVPLPKGSGIGYDVAGVIEAIGSRVSKLKVGDEIYSKTIDAGAIEEYVISAEKYVALKPTNLSFEEAAAVPLAAMIAQIGIIDHGKVTKETVESAFVPAGLGGVGYFALQILTNVIGVKRVITTVSTGKIEKVKQLLPNVEVIDYKKKDFGKELKDSVDFIFDTTGELSKEAAAVKPNAGKKVVSIAAVPSGTLVSNLFPGLAFYMRYILNVLFWWDSRWFTKQGVDYDYILLEPSAELLYQLKEWIEAGKVKVLIDKVYEFDQAIEALAHLRDGGVTGKVVVRIS